MTSPASTAPPLRARLHLLVGVTALPLLALIGYTTWDEARLQTQDAEVSTQRAARRLAADAERVIRRAQDRLLFLSRQADIAALDPGHCPMVFTRLGGLFPEYTNLLTFTRDGERICSALPPPPGTPSRLDRRVLPDRLRESRTFIVGDATQGTLTRRWVAVVAQPLRAATGDPPGFVAVTLDLASLEIAPDPETMPPSAQARIVDGTGAVIASSVAADTRGAAVAASDTPQATDDRIEASEPVEGTLWRASVSVSRSEVFAAAKARALYQTALAAAAMACAALLSYGIARRTARPIEAIAAAARHATSSRAPPSMHPGDRWLRHAPREVQALAADFQAMLDARFDAERALADSEWQLRLITQALPGPVSRVDRGGRLLFANPAHERWFGTDGGPDPLTRLSEAHLEQVHDGLEARWEAEVPTRDGPRQAHVTLIPDIDEAGQVVGHIRVVMDVSAYKAAQAALQASQDRYLHTLEDMLEGGQIIGNDWRYLFINAAGVEHARKPRHELLGRTMMEVYPGIEQSDLFAAIAGCMQDRVPRRMENQFVYPDGQTAWFELRIQAVPDGVFILSMDITQRRQAEAALRDSESQLRRLMDMAPLPICHINAAGAFTFRNRRFFQFFGYDEHEVRTLGDWWPRVLPDPVERQQVVDLWRSAANAARRDGTDITPQEARLHSRSGEVKLVQATGITLPDGVLTVFIDLTELKRNEVVLAAYREHLEALVTARTAELEAANDQLRHNDQRLLAMYDLSQRAPQLDEPSLLRLAVESAAQTTHSDAGCLQFADAGGHGPMVSSTDPLLRVRLADACAEVRRQGAALRDPEDAPAPRRIAVPVTVEGEVQMVMGLATTSGHHTESDLQTLQLMADDVWGIVVRRRAELALARARDAAEAASRAKSTFLANMSHEIRTPMNAIIGMTHLLHDEITEPQPRARLGKVRAAADHLLNIINDVLDLSKIEAGRLTLERRPLSLRQLVGHTLEMLGERAAARGLQLRDDLDPAVPDWVLGDPLRLEQVLVNFVGNAIKFSERGTITVRLRPGATPAPGRNPRLASIRLEVQDEGIGLTSEEQGRIFQAFGQADDSTSRRYGGSGLGLVIAQRLARLMGGDVSVTSRHGEGSTFRLDVALPRADEARPAATAPDAGRAEAEQQLMAGHRGARVLIVDDDLVNQEVTGALLRRLGLDVHVAGDGAEAVDTVRANRPALVLMDMQMPVMDGLQATRAIRALPDGAGLGLPIIAMTANAFAEDRDACLAAGMDDHVSKPVELQKFYTCLLRWLPARR